MVLGYDLFIKNSRHNKIKILINFVIYFYLLYITTGLLFILNYYNDIGEN